MTSKASIPLLVAANMLAQAADAGIAQDSAQPNPGVIAAANAARYNEQHFDQPLTTYSVGWVEQQDLLAEVRAVCGAPVPVSHRFTYKTFLNVEAFLGNADEDYRAIGAAFPRVDYKSDEVEGRLHNRGLTYRIDRDAIDGDEFAHQQRIVRLLTERILRNRLLRAKALVSAAAVNTGKTWDISEGKDPDQDVLTELLTSADLIGFQPNTVNYGDTAWSKRHLSFRAQNNAGGYASAPMTPDQLRGLLMVDKVHVSKARYSSSATARTGILGNLVQMYLTSDSAMVDDPSTIKCFTKGSGIRVFVEEVGTKFIDITVEDYELLSITSNLGVRQFTVS